MSLLSSHPRYALATALSFLALIVLSFAIYKGNSYIYTIGKVIEVKYPSGQNMPYIMTIEYQDQQQQKHQTQIKSPIKPKFSLYAELRYPKDLSEKASLSTPNYLWTLRILRYFATFIFLSCVIALCKIYKET